MGMNAKCAGLPVQSTDRHCFRSLWQSCNPYCDPSVIGPTGPVPFHCGGSISTLATMANGLNAARVVRPPQVRAPYACPLVKQKWATTADCPHYVCVGATGCHLRIQLSWRAASRRSRLSNGGPYTLVAVFPMECHALPWPHRLECHRKRFIYPRDT